jgi:4-diphosphocytidyl-2-C-methyl-D-erythritol kinase
MAVSSRALVVRPSAKINLTLRVGARRDNGYHDIRTLFQSVALHDTLTISPRPGPFSIECRAPGVPNDQSNIVWRAADALWRAMGRPGDPRDVHIKIEKGIPAAAGLGGGSSDAASALGALHSLWGGRLSRRALLELAAALGSDVPFFFHGGAALGLSRGEELYPVDDVRRLGVVLIKPSFGVSAADAYRWLDEDRAAGVAGPSVERRRDVDVGWSDLLTLDNDLEGPVARRHPAVLEMIEACYREGALAAAMTGSGSVVFGLFTETGAKRAVRQLQRPDWLVILTHTLSRREAARRPPDARRHSSRQP